LTVVEGTGSPVRLRSVDILKGAAISIIVILHIGIVVKSDVGEPSPIVQALYLGLISFFIISGYFFKPGRGFRENMRRRLKVLFLALVTAAVCLSLICFLWCLLWGQPTNLDDLALCLERAFTLERSFLDFDIRAPDPRIPWAICGFSAGYYFLWVLLIACVIFYAVADRIRENKKLGILVIAALLGVTIAYRELFSFSLPFNLNLCPIAAVFMIIGMYLAKHEVVERIEAAGLRSGKFWALFLGSMAATLALVFLLPPSIDFDFMDFGKYGGYSAIPYTVEATCAFFMLICLCYMISKIPLISTVFSEVGKHTLGILLLHLFVAKMILAPFFTFGSDVSLASDFTGPMRYVLAVVSLVICYLICAYGPAVVKRVASKKDKA
jgi:fucose 4-O-acetylase-like acetyltransferase